MVILCIKKRLDADTAPLRLTPLDNNYNLYFGLKQASLVSQIFEPPFWTDIWTLFQDFCPVGCTEADTIIIIQSHSMRAINCSGNKIRKQKTLTFYLVSAKVPHRCNEQRRPQSQPGVVWVVQWSHQVTPVRSQFEATINSLVASVIRSCGCHGA